jgi:hypothetical protein
MTFLLCFIVCVLKLILNGALDRVLAQEEIEIAHLPVNGEDMKKITLSLSAPAH